MPNTKPVGVAYSDPELVSGTTISGASITNSTYVSSATTDAVISNANAGFYILSTAITANTTTTSAPAGSLGITTNATGRGKLFYADGTKWQFMAIT
jgi:hypothetical protein